MKRFFISVFVILVAVSIKAQTTYNVRVGGGLANVKVHDYEDYDSSDHTAAAAISFQANVPFQRHSPLSFSPTLITAYVTDFDVVFTVPLYIGYKKRIGDQKLFFPKIGPMVSFETYDGRFTVGPSVELAFELKHFVVAINGYMGLLSTGTGGAFLTMGYKF